MGRISNYVILLFVLATTMASSGSGSSSTQQDLVDKLSALITVTLSHTNLSLPALTSREPQHAQKATGYCRELMSMSAKSLNQALKALRKKTPGKEDVQTWLSAAITYQQACKDRVSAHVATNAHMAEIHEKMDHLSALGSNPLALVNRLATIGGGRRRRRRGLLDFPNWVSRPERKLLNSSGRTRPDVVVAQDGSGNYTTVTEAIRAVPRGGRRFVIHVKRGTYYERINTNKDGITLIGDGKYLTIITSNGSVDKGFTLAETATFTITGNRFIARDIGFFNSAGRHAAQAIALAASSYNAVFYRCSMAGYQDTLFAISLRQFYRECHIYGTIDFIFGNAAAVFQNCILVLRRPRHGASNVILASSRSDPGQNTGFVLQNCTITAGSELAPVRRSYKSYLGRPWKSYSRAVVMQSYIHSVISRRGWLGWPGAPDSTESTLYFAEYKNVGPGSRTSGRVKWPGFRVINSTREAKQFTVAKFIEGNSWLPSTRVHYKPGLR